MSDQKTRVETCVDHLCEQGCSMVNGYIDALKNGEEFPEVAGMSKTDREAVLQQLVEIMAVYDGVCDR